MTPSCLADDNLGVTPWWVKPCLRVGGILQAMYAPFFGLQHPPFSIAPDPRYLFMSERHREALAHLLYGVQGGGGVVLLTGQIGAGKTTVCRAFLEQVPANCRVAYIFNPKLTVNDLLKTICHEFQLEVRHEGIGPATIKDYLDPLNEYLLRSHAAGQRTVHFIGDDQTEDQGQGRGGHGHEGFGAGFPLGDLFVGHIHHMGFAALVQMRQVGLGLLGIGLVHRLLSEVGDKVARLGAGIELIADQLLPTQLTGAGGAGQAKNQGAIGKASGSA